MRSIFLYLFFLSSFFQQAYADDVAKKQSEIIEQFLSLTKNPECAFFDPPNGWGLVDARELPKSVCLMAVGEKNHGHAPSIYLATEKYQGTMNRYLKLAKEIALSHGGKWRDLGTMETEAGKARISQVESELSWGTNCMLHAFVLHEGTMHIITASAPKKDFGSYESLFLPVIQSMRLGKAEAIQENTESIAESTTAEEKVHPS